MVNFLDKEVVVQECAGNLTCLNALHRSLMKTCVEEQALLVFSAAWEMACPISFKKQASGNITKQGKGTCGEYLANIFRSSLLFDGCCKLCFLTLLRIPGRRNVVNPEPFYSSGMQFLHQAPGNG
jgi:hypothetical protein